MQQLHILNTRDNKEISELIKKQYGCKFDFKGYAVFMNDKNKIYIVKRDIGKLNFDELRFNSIGMYFGEVNRGELRLSIEGSQIIGQIAKKGILELSYEESKLWMKGHDFKVKSKEEGFLIIKHHDDFLGCGKVKDKTLLNYVPKERRE